MNVRGARCRGRRKSRKRLDRLDRSQGNTTVPPASSERLYKVATREQTTTNSDLLRPDKMFSSWRWSNVPLPEPHLAGILTCVVLHLTHPWRLAGSGWLYGSAGWPLVGTGVAISASAVRAASEVDLERTSTLISSGPYAISRNPMYVGWTLLYLGAALITRNAWMIASLPAVAGFIHRDVLREEHTLEGAFGEDYARYRKLVRRYT